jgi:hypothetical protein
MEYGRYGRGVKMSGALTREELQSVDSRHLFAEYLKKAA